ncbi:MAG: hypothetical protein JXA69_13110 [Phycisphaerae bacterium]|nr:hypothetical protein [Phycisphaerae bacterium]
MESSNAVNRGASRTYPDACGRFPSRSPTRPGAGATLGLLVCLGLLVAPVTAAVGQPSIAADKTRLDFDTTRSSDALQIWNNGDGALTYTVAVTAGEAYFKVSATNGTSTGSANTTTHTVTLDRAKLSVGQVVLGTLTITASSVSNSPYTIGLYATGSHSTTDPSTLRKLTVTIAGGSGTVSPANGVFPDNATALLTAVPAPGYRIKAWTGTANDSCTACANATTMDADKTVSVVFEPVPVIAEAGVAQTILFGKQAQMEGSATGGLAPYVFAWTPPEGLANSADPRTIAQPTASTTYTLTVTDALGQAASDTVVIAVVPQLVANAGPDHTLAHGESVMLAGAASGGQPPYQYLWAPSAGLSDPHAAAPTAKPASTTTYVLTVTDAYAQLASDAVTIDLAPGAVLSVHVDDGEQAARTLPAKEYAIGTWAEIQAPDPPGIDYQFDHWSGDATGRDNPLRIYMDGNKQVTAVFTSTTSPAPEAAACGAGIMPTAMLTLCGLMAFRRRLV